MTNEAGLVLFDSELKNQEITLADLFEQCDLAQANWDAGIALQHPEDL